MFEVGFACVCATSQTPLHQPLLCSRCTVLHGSKSQDQREAGIKGFRDATFNVLIATDVAGRGIDVPDVALVVNYDMPNTIEAYTHRIGRTGRAGKKGTSLTLLTMSDTEVSDRDKMLPVQPLSVRLHFSARRAKPWQFWTNMDPWMHRPGRRKGVKTQTQAHSKKWTCVVMHNTLFAYQASRR